MKKLAVLLILLVGALPAVAQDATATPTAADTETPTAMELPAEVVFESPVPGLLPEGVEWDAEAGAFLVGSLSSGTIRSVADDGTVADRFTDENLSSTVGIHIANGKLYVANSDASVFGNPDAVGKASLAVFDLETGELVTFTDLTEAFEGEGNHFANDVTADPDGNAYVTDSFKPVIYKVTPEGEGSVLLESELLTNENFGINGIDYHPDGYLLVALTGAGGIVKVPLPDRNLPNDPPAEPTMVELSEPVGIDGMALGADGVLYAVGRTGAEQTQEVVAIASDDDWQTASVVARTPTDGNATTLALRYAAEGESPAVYYVNVYFGQTDRTEYQIVHAPLVVEQDLGE